MNNLKSEIEMYCTKCEERTEWELYDYTQDVATYDCTGCGDSYHERR